MSYTVKAGDSLSIIAEKELGDLSLWTYLASINNLTSPYTLYPGQQLNIDIPTATAKKKYKPWVWLVLFAAAGGGYYYYKKKKKGLPKFK